MVWLTRVSVCSCVVPTETLLSERYLHMCGHGLDLQYRPPKEFKTSLICSYGPKPRRDMTLISAHGCVLLQLVGLKNGWQTASGAQKVPKQLEKIKRADSETIKYHQECRNKSGKPLKTCNTFTEIRAEMAGKHRDLRHTYLDGKQSNRNYEN